MFASCHAHARQSTFLKKHYLFFFVTILRGVTSTRTPGCGMDLTLLGRIDARIYMCLCFNSHGGIQFVSVRTSERSPTTYRESGAQNDHIIFLIHVVSTAFPVSPSFCREK